jgi:phosphopantetheinyl transferase
LSTGSFIRPLTQAPGWHDLDIELVTIEQACHEAESLLTPTERQLFGRIGIGRRRSWLASRVAIKRLGHRLAPEIESRFIETCRMIDTPSCCLFPDGRSVPVSVAHDSYYVLAAMAACGKRVGVDIEPVDQRCVRVIERYFPSWPADPLPATRLWTACEAVAKCSRTALAEVLRTANCRADGPERVFVDIPMKSGFLVRNILFENRILAATSSPIA